MPKAEFEPLIANRTKVDFRGIHADSIERFRIRDLIESRVLSDAMLDDILGPWCCTICTMAKWSF